MEPLQLQALDPFPLLTLPDLVLQHILQHLTPVERKATRGTCRKLCKVASDSGAAVITPEQHCKACSTCITGSHALLWGGGSVSAHAALLSWGTYNTWAALQRH